MNAIASSRDSGSLSFGRDAEGKRSSSSLRASSSASLAIWLGSLPGIARERHSFQAWFCRKFGESVQQASNPSAYPSLLLGGTGGAAVHVSALFCRCDP